MIASIDLTEKETLVVLNMAAEKELSVEGILRQAIRTYQLVEERRKQDPNIWNLITPPSRMLPDAEMYQALL